MVRTNTELKTQPGFQETWHSAHTRLISGFLETHHDDSEEQGVGWGTTRGGERERAWRGEGGREGEGQGKRDRERLTAGLPFPNT